METEWMKYVLAILSGLVTAIPLIVNLVKYIRSAVKEKNWDQVLQLVMRLMKEAEVKFQTGAERKEWVMAIVKSSADTINYDINMDQISQIIDDLCAMTKVVNPPAELNQTA